MTIDLPVAFAKRSVPAADLVTAFRAPDAHFPRRRVSATKKLGIRFENKVINQLKQIYPRIETQPHFRFVLCGKQAESCFPDAILQTQKHTIIIEVKYKHTYDGYAQLTRLYLPVVQCVYKRPIVRLEICKTYDPDVKLPEASEVLTRGALQGWIGNEPARKASYGVLIWGR